MLAWLWKNVGFTFKIFLFWAFLRVFRRTNYFIRKIHSDIFREVPLLLSRLKVWSLKEPMVKWWFFGERIFKLEGLTIPAKLSKIDLRGAFFNQNLAWFVLALVRGSLHLASLAQRFWGKGKILWFSESSWFGSIKIQTNRIEKVGERRICVGFITNFL